MTKIKCNLSIRNILITIFIIIVVLTLIHGISRFAGKTIEGLDKNLVEQAAIHCVADYGTDTSKALSKHICPKAIPICNHFVPGKFQGVCGYKKSPNKMVDFVFEEPRPPAPPNPCSWTAQEAGWDYPGNDMTVDPCCPPPAPLPPVGKCEYNPPWTSASIAYTWQNAVGAVWMNLFGENGCKQYPKAKCESGSGTPIGGTFCKWTETPAPAPAGVKKMQNISLQDCKQKCQDKQSAGCKGIVYDAADKICWLKDRFGAPNKANNRQGSILNAGCSKPKIPVPVPAPVPPPTSPPPPPPKTKPQCNATPPPTPAPPPPKAPSGKCIVNNPAIIAAWGPDQVSVNVSTVWTPICPTRTTKDTCNAGSTYIPPGSATLPNNSCPACCIWVPS